MEITEEVLSTLRKISEKEYDEQLAVHNTLISPIGAIKSADTLSRLTGEIKILTFLEDILDSDPQAIEILNYLLNDVQEQKKWKN